MGISVVLWWEACGEPRTNWKSFLWTRNVFLSWSVFWGKNTMKEWSRKVSLGRLTVSPVSLWRGVRIGIWIYRACLSRKGSAEGEQLNRKQTDQVSNKLMIILLEKATILGMLLGICMVTLQIQDILSGQKMLEYFSKFSIRAKILCKPLG